MPFRIHDIQHTAPGSFPQYFLDANVWIAALKSMRNASTPSQDTTYVNFFDSIVQINAWIGTKHEKKFNVFPKFVMNSMLVSEIFNAYMRNVSMKAFYGPNYASKEFKRDYRKSSDYEVQLSLLVADLKSYQDCINIVNDMCREVDPFSVLGSMNNTVDFNDAYYCHYLYDQKIPIVTNDGDFAFQDIDIITSNPKLLSLMKAQVRS